MFLLSLSASAITLLAPDDNSSTYMIHPHFRWEPDPSADRYEIQIANNSSFTSIQQSDSIPVPRYVPLDHLPVNNDYWWRVRTQYANGSTGNWSASRKLTVQIAAAANRYWVYPSNTLAQITNTIAAAVATAPSRLIFGAGTYELALPDDAYLLKFENVRDLYVEGNFSDIIMTNPNSGFSDFNRCENILIRRFNIDYHDGSDVPITHTAGRVVSVDPVTHSFEFSRFEEYLPPTDPRIAGATFLRWGALMDPDTRGRLKTGVNNWFDITTNVVVMTNGNYRLFLEGNHESRISDFKPDDIFVKIASYGQAVMKAQDSTNITYSLITSYRAAGNHFSGSYNDSIHFLRCASRIKGDGYISTPGGGGYVGASYLTGFWIEECLTEGLLDDAVNLANRPANMISVSGTNEFRASGRIMRSLKAGDDLTIYTPSLGRVNGSFKVIDIQGSGGERTITVDGDIGQVHPGTANTNTLVYADKLAHPHAYIRNSTFRNSRRFGVLFRSHGGVAEGSMFAGLSDGGIDGGNLCSAFSTGFDNRNVRILNNTFIDCGYVSPFYQQQRGVLEFQARAASGTNCTQMIHRNVEISGNEILDWSRKAIAVKNTAGLLVYSNTVKNLNETGFYSGGQNYAVYLDYTSNSIVTGNDLRDTRPMNAAVYAQNSADCTVIDNLMFGDIIYNDDFSGALNGIPGFPFVANQTAASGGKLAASSVTAAANYRFQLADNPLTSDPDVTAIRWAATLKTPTNDWIGIGFHGATGNGFLASGADTGPWVQFLSNGEVRIQGGHGTSGSSDTYSSLYAPGAVISAEFVFHVIAQTADLLINGTPVAVGLPITHKLQSDGSVAAPAIHWAQLHLRSQSPVGAYIDRFEIETLPIEIR